MVDEIRGSVRITISNIDDVQAVELIRMLWLMEQCGRIGASRWLAFYADGDGAFRPQISVNDESVYTVMLPDRTRLEWDQNWRKGKVEAYLFDPD